MRILVATDGSPCSELAVSRLSARPWFDGSQIEIVTVVHTAVPLVPDLLMAGTAAHFTALEEDRQRAPDRVRSAERRLTGIPGTTVTALVVEGDPAKAIIEEAARFKADLVVVGSHGHSPLKGRLLGSVSEAVALGAPCSVEIVRCI